MTDQKKISHGGRNLNFLFIVGLILAIITIIFAIQNAETIEIEFFSFHTEPHLALLIISCIAVGSLLTLMFSIPGWWSRKRAKSALQKELKDLRKKYEDLASIQHSSSSNTSQEE